ncbi:MAG: ATP-dependent DNA helicase RecG [Patescibacteria group bacterium]
MNLKTKVTELNRVGKTLERKLRRLGVEIVQDLLFYFPFRYEDYSQVTLIKDLKDGMQTTVKGKIEIIANKRSPRKRKIITEAVVADETGRIRVIWFGQPFITKILRVGDNVYLSGKVSGDMFGVTMKGPSYERNKKQETRNKDDVVSTTHTARIVPMYSLTSGITQKQLRFLMSQVIGEAEKIDEWLPEEILEKADLITLPFALKAIHFPETKEELKQAERRLKFGELFVLQLRAEMIRQSMKRYQASRIKFKEKETREFVQSLPFTLTRDQKIAAWEILRDLEKGEPMNRLLEGDVGSGKTVVAGIAAYNAALNGLQTAIMAPTEILSKQHFETLKKLFSDRPMVLLTSEEIGNWKLEIGDGSKRKMREETLKLIREGEVQIIVGTHALLTEDVEFKNLGLVVVDEQHRFGVEQRKVIREKSGFTEVASDKSGQKNTVPHFLSMTATPIPRSFALTIYGDLDLSIIRELPVGRKPVKTRAVESRSREKAYGFIRSQVETGRQVFVICPLIEERTLSRKPEAGSRKPEIDGQVTSYPAATGSRSLRDKLQVTHFDEKKSVLREYEKLSKNIFPDLKVGFLHGRMKTGDKDKTMEQFNNGTINVLVSTSVVEVGVDIPNASVMMIEGADRFGLAQLHQFRGRVGRSEHQSYCFLFTDSDSEKVRERLAYFEKVTDGFKVAEYDLKTRGPGEVYGTAQSGMMNLRLATFHDHELIKLARELARGIDFGKYPALRERVREWEGRVHLE